MNGTRTSGWLLLVVMMALVPLTRGTGAAPPAGPGKVEGVEEKDGGTTKDADTQPKSQPSSQWDGPARLVSDLTGEYWDGKGDGKTLWLGFAAEVKKAKFTRLDPLIALVPCPVDSNRAEDFDQAVSAIQEAYADAGYLLEGWWLPWTGDPEKDRARERIPGLMVFRRYNERERERAAVLVVGEVPVRGVHQAAFREAVEALRQWAKDMPASSKGVSGAVTIRVLGPALSDSVLSLRQAIEDSNPSANESYEVITGSARAKDVFVKPWPVRTTVVTDEELQKRARKFFEEEMGWNPRRVALLTEADRAYGQPFLTRQNALDSVLVRFPPGIAGVRSAWDQDQRPREASSNQGTVKIPEVTLDLRLSDRSRPVQVPEFSTLTTASRDLAIGNLLARLSDSKVSYIGVLASDPRDAAFLVARIRRFARSALVFLVDSDLVFTHPKLGPTLNSTLVISSFSLFAGDRFTGEMLIPPPAGEHARQYLSQFTSDLHEGIYRAARRLIASARHEKIPNEEPKVWISTIGNGSFWPLAVLDGKTSGAICPPWPWSHDKKADNALKKRLSAGAATKLLVGALALCFLTYLLFRFANPPQDACPRAGWLLAAAASSLGLAAGVLAILGSLYYRRLGASIRIGDDWKQIVTALFLLLTAAALVFIVVRAVSIRKGMFAQFVLVAAVALVAAGLLFGLNQVLCHLWRLARLLDAEFFLRRALTFSSGLSPLVSLAWLVGAFYLWAFIELRRERMQARQLVDWPGQGPTITSFERCRSEAKQLKELLDGPWPRWAQLRSLVTYLACKLRAIFSPAKRRECGSPSSPLWVLLVPILLTLPFLALWVSIHPIAEPRIYGKIFLLLLAFTFFLGAYSFCRFLGAWLILKKILNLLTLPHPPEILDDELAKLVRWSPMKSFGWAIPRFTMPSLLADQVNLVPPVDEALAKVLKAYLDQELDEEIEARGALRGRYDQFYSEVKQEDIDQPVIRRFIALRLVSYIRYIFAHLRGLLLAAGACGFPLLVAASSYAFEPDEILTNGIWAALLVAVLVTLLVFLQMERDVVLSKISGTEPKEIELNKQLVTNFLTYGAVPLLGLIASQFPQVGRFTVSLVNPLLRAVGGGP